MKCPKCGYLGFETTDRCRNCQYDFSLARSSSEPDLALHDDHLPDPGADLDLSALPGPAAGQPPGPLDLDRLFGDADPDVTAPAVTDGAPRDAVQTPASSRPAGRHRPPHDGGPAGANALPFDDAPMMPRAARTPLAVRRATPELPRNRPRTTRPVRMESPLAFEGETPPARPAAGGQTTAAAASDTVALLMETPPLAARLGAALIDLVLLLGIYAVVVFLTLRITGLESTLDDARVLPLVPFAGFLCLVGFGYIAAFTVAGGQTIGKMLLKLRVIGDDGRPVDAAGGVLRAVGCMLVPITAGLSYVPVLFSSDHRALHDRLAGTRVVRE
jgi:uncharacterized RDD family membrane protein YckC